MIETKELNSIEREEYHGGQGISSAIVQTKNIIEDKKGRSGGHQLESLAEALRLTFIIDLVISKS